MRKVGKNKSKVDIYQKYRVILEMQQLTNREIEAMRRNLRIIAQTICEHVWGKKFY